MSATGLPDAVPPRDPHPHLPNPHEEWIQGTVPSLWEAQSMSARALETMRSAESELRLAHDNHARTEERYRKLKFSLAMKVKVAGGVEIDGKFVKLTDRERGQWVDAECAGLKSRMRHEWGLVESARAAATRADRAQATVKHYTAWAQSAQREG